MGREMGRWFKREGAYEYLWLIHVDIWQKPTKFCKAIILQLKINKFKKTQNTWKLNNTVLKKKCVIEDIKNEFRKYLKTNENKNTTL